MSVPVGITVPKLLPITGTFAPAFALYYSVLSYRVSMARVNSEQWVGQTTTDTTDPVFLASRCHQNFTENVPLALFMGAVVEMNGGNRRVLTGGLAALLVFRILHVEFGIKGEDGKGNKALGPGRIVGHTGTLAFVLGMAGYAGWLVKGYWGL